MNLLKLHNHVLCSFHLSQITLPIPRELKHILTFSKISSFPSKSFPKLKFSISRVSKIETLTLKTCEEENGEKNTSISTRYGDSLENSIVYRKTLRLVECAMFAAVSGLAYFLSSTLGIERFLASFFPLPIVISSVRWGAGAGRKTMVATAMLLLVLSGPVNALAYLLTHGLVGVTMGYLWRSGANWSLSMLLCTFVDAIGTIGCFLLSSFLIRENIPALIAIRSHASLTYIFTAIGINSVPSMSSIYAMFGTLVLFRSVLRVHLLHYLFAIFLKNLGLSFR